ncbi:MAG TPA: hypothetical protein V6D35_21530 [Candidatus Sericytochromatia bacterium]
MTAKNHLSQEQKERLLKTLKEHENRVHPNFAKIPGCAHQELIFENDNQG